MLKKIEQRIPQRYKISANNKIFLQLNVKKNNIKGFILQLMQSMKPLTIHEKTDLEKIWLNGDHYKYKLWKAGAFAIYFFIFLHCFGWQHKRVASLQGCLLHNFPLKGQIEFRT